MEDEERQSSESPAEPNVSSVHDETLDLTSAKFDPIKALQSDAVQLLVPNVPGFETIGSIRMVVDTPFVAVPPEGPAPKFVRNFQPHQEPIKTTSTFVERNILTRMTECEGPLQQLNTYVREQTRVKIVTRGAKGIRGYCTGFLTVFDKYWNVALKDVVEVWNRKKKRKVPALGDGGGGTAVVTPRYVQLPQVSVVRLSRSWEQCTRRIPQLMMRGEHVVLVTPLAPPHDQLPVLRAPTTTC